MTDRSFRSLFFTLALAGLLLDQASKYLVFQWLHNEPPYDAVPGVFQIDAHHVPGPSQPLVNQCALFGFRRAHGGLANAIFAVISLAAAAAILFWATRRSTSRDWSLSNALGLILAGTLGNLYDRVVFNGVRDFLHLHYREFDWPVFNIADSCLVCGAILLLTQALFSRVPADQPAPDGRGKINHKTTEMFNRELLRARPYRARRSSRLNLRALDAASAGRGPVPLAVLRIFAGRSNPYRSSQRSSYARGWACRSHWDCSSPACRTCRCSRRRRFCTSNRCWRETIRCAPFCRAGDRGRAGSSPCLLRAMGAAFSGTAAARRSIRPARSCWRPGAPRSVRATL